MNNPAHSASAQRWHHASAIAGAIIALAGIGVGALLTTGPGVERALAIAPDSGSDIPAIQLDRDTLALVVDRAGIVYLVNQDGRAVPVRYEERTLNNIPGEEILRAR